VDALPSGFVPACHTDGSTWTISVAESIPSDFVWAPFPPCGCTSMPPAQLQVVYAGTGDDTLDGTYVLEMAGAPGYYADACGGGTWDGGYVNYSYTFPSGPRSGQTIGVTLAATNAAGECFAGSSDQYYIALNPGGGVAWDGAGCTGLDKTVNFTMGQFGAGFSGSARITAVAA
jgi:hypothetical protein